MALRPNDWLELRDMLRRPLGEEASAKLMEFLPPVGWADVATTRDLGGMEEHLRAEMHLLEVQLHSRLVALDATVAHALRRQTVWLTTALLAGMGLAGALARF